MGRPRKQRGILFREIPLNALALGIAISGILIPLYTQSPAGIVAHTTAMLADSGASLSAAVPPNPYNTLADQLNQKEQELNAREAALNAKDAKGAFPTTGDMFGILSFILSVILCALVGLNFYLDSRRGKKGGTFSNKYSVDLS